MSYMNSLSYARWYFLPVLWMRLPEEEPDFIAGLYVRRNSGTQCNCDE